MKQTYCININGKCFNYRKVYHNAAGMVVNIGTTSIIPEIMNVDGTYKGNYAQCIDEIFYAYVDDNLFDELSYEDFVKYVNENFD